MGKSKVVDLRTAVLCAQMESDRFREADDSGTSNWDTPVILLKQKDWTTDDIRFALEGTHIRYTTEPGRKDFVVWVFCTSGQGYRRTKMTEAFCESLRNSGYEAFVYYKMD